MALPQTPPYPLATQYLPTAASFELTWGTLGRFLYDSMSPAFELPSEPVFANATEMLGVSRGQFKPTFALEMPQLEAERLLTALGAAPLKAMNTVDIQGREGDFDVHYTIEGVHLTKLPVKVEKGKASSYSLECGCTGATRNGQKLI